MKTLRLSIIAFIAVATIASCTKHDSFENTLHDCECGTMDLDGRELSVRLAEGFVPDSTNQDLWRYLVIADYRTEEEQINHTPSEDVSFTVDILLSGGNASEPAQNVLTTTYIELPIENNWPVTDGEVSVSSGDSIHTLTFSNVVAETRVINGEFTIIPE